MIDKRVLSVAIATISVLSTSVLISIGASGMGDVNKDDKVTSADALGVLGYSVGLTSDGGDYDFSGGDVNGDGVIDSADALEILNATVGLSEIDDTATETVYDVNSSETQTVDSLVEETTTAEEVGDVAVDGWVFPEKLETEWRIYYNEMYLKLVKYNNSNPTHNAFLSTVLARAYGKENVKLMCEIDPSTTCSTPMFYDEEDGKWYTDKIVY